MISNIGIPGLILILVLALIIFGPKKLPELGKAVGQTFKEFKNSTKGLIDDEDDDKMKKGRNRHHPIFGWCLAFFSEIIVNRMTVALFCLGG